MHHPWMIMWAVEVHVPDYGFSPAQQDEIWRRWRDGESFNAPAARAGRRHGLEVASQVAATWND
jgi:hypothetical protein